MTVEMMKAPWLPHDAATVGNENSAMMMPAGQQLTKTAIAPAISAWANQSATILVMMTLTITPPAPASNRPTTSAVQPENRIGINPPTMARTKPSVTANLSPATWLIAPLANG